MKIENLEEGKVFKNYPALCEALGIVAKRGDSKTAQMKQIERYVKLEKNGNKLIVVEVYKEAKKKNDKREFNKGGNNIVYANDFVTLLASDLVDRRIHSNSNKVIFSSSRLSKLVGLTNDNFADARMYINELSEITELPEHSIREFYNMNSDKLKQIVRNGLKACNNVSILAFEETLIVNVVKPIITYNEHGLIEEKIDETCPTITRKATEEEIEMITEIERQSARELGFKKKQGLFLNNKLDEYSRLIDSKLREAKSNIMYYYKGFVVFINPKGLMEYYKDNNILDEDLGAVRTTMNYKLLNSIFESAKNKNSTSQKKLLESKRPRKDVVYQASDIYVDEQLKVANVLIHRNAKKLKKELEARREFNQNKETIPF